MIAKKIEISVGLDAAFPSKLMEDVKNEKDLLVSNGISIISVYKEKNLVLAADVIVTIVVTFSTTVAAEIFARWLYDKIKDNATKIRIEKTLFEIDEDGIRRLLLEKREEG